MNVFVFFSSVQTAMMHRKYILDGYDPQLNYIYLSTKSVEVSDVEMAEEGNFSFIENECLNSALSCASKLVDLDNDTIVMTVDVFPTDTFKSAIYGNLERFPNMVVAFGRWYQEPLKGRHHVSRLGYKFKDVTPKLIANHIVNHTPSFDSHAKTVTRFPIFFNWFSRNVSSELKNAMCAAVSFSEMSLFICEYLQSATPDKEMFYLPELEVLDRKVFLREL